jgi:homospermidine synthase
VPLNRKFLDELKTEWKNLWQERIDDKVRAEGIASKDYPRLEVERGLIIVATRDYKPLDFAEILRRHKVAFVDPSIGGWGKFVRDVISKQKRVTKRRENCMFLKRKCKGEQQRKKGGRGWLHFRMDDGSI